MRTRAGAEDGQHEGRADQRHCARPHLERGGGRADVSRRRTQSRNEDKENGSGEKSGRSNGSVPTSPGCRASSPSSPSILKIPITSSQRSCSCGSHFWIVRELHGGLRSTVRWRLHRARAWFRRRSAGGNGATDGLEKCPSNSRWRSATYREYSGRNEAPAASCGDVQRTLPPGRGL